MSDENAIDNPTPVLGARATVSGAPSSSLVNINTNPVPDGSLVWVRQSLTLYVLRRASTATPNGVTIVQPSAGPGRWFALLDAQADWATQSAWFIDSTNGNDDNDGATAATAIRTLAELQRRISGQEIQQNTLITLAAGSYDDLVLDLEVPSGVLVTIQGALTQTASGTLSAVTNSNPLVNPNVSTRGAITNTGGDPAFVDKTRLRLTSGANAGALAWVTRVIAANNVNVARWARTDPAVTTLPTIGNAAIGNTYAVETMDSSLQRVDLRCRGQGRILVRECDITIVGASQAHRAMNDQGTLGGVYFYSCRFGGSSCLWYGGEALFVSCGFQSSVTVFQNAYMAMRASVVTGAGGLTLDGGSVANMARSNCFDGAGITVHTAWLQFTGSPGDCEFSDQTGASINTWPGGFADNDSGCILWGADNATATTLVVRSLSPGFAPAALNLLNIPGGVNDTTIGGTATAYGALPFFNTARGCGIVLRA